MMLEKLVCFVFPKQHLHRLCLVLQLSFIHLNRAELQYQTQGGSGNSLGLL